MKERPILFKGAMVRAILEDRKTQTRRIARIESLKIEPTNTILSLSCRFSKPHKKSLSVFTGTTWTHRQAQEWLGHTYSPYGKPGDRLWVRETWGVGTRPHPIDGWFDGIEYQADEPLCDGIENMPLYRAPENIDLSKYDKLGWKPSIHMPRWASRIDLEIVSVRVERLQDITEEDAKAEGVDGPESESAKAVGWCVGPKAAYRFLWNSINGVDAWDANPYVWVVEFKRVKP